MRRLPFALAFLLAAAVPASASASDQRPVPILAYHSVGSPSPTARNDDLYVRRRDFRRQVRWLAGRGFKAVTLDRVEDAWFGNRSLPAHPVVFTFDDGFASQYLNAYPTLAARHWPAVLDLPVRLKTGGAAKLDPDQVRHLLHHRWELASHSISHPNLTELGPHKLHRQVARSKVVLHREYGVAVRNFAYPYGALSPRVERVVRRAGYRGATGVTYGLASPSERYRLDRIVIERADGLAGFEAKFGALARRPRAPTLTRSTASGASSRLPRGRVVTLGRSVRGRVIKALRLGNPDSPHKALVVGVIHGDETAGLRVIRALRRRWAGVGGVDLWTVYSVNPDGMARDTRRNADGVDLNRNFSYRWRGGVPRSSGYYPGPRPFSEPESRLVRRLIRRLRPAVTIYYHQPWGQVLAPCRGDARLERRYSRLSGLPMKRCRGEHLSGTATSWQEHHFPGTSAFVVEFPPGRISAATARRHARAAALVAGGH